MNRVGFGVELKPLTIETAELLRQWRNNPRILQQMEYQESITSEMQLRWFQAIQNSRFAYFIIYADLVPIGMIHLSQIDVLAKRAEAGLFLGDDRFSGTGIALGASILLLNYAFDDLGLMEVTAKVKSGNIVAENYNAILGFEKTEDMKSGFNWWSLTAERYATIKENLIAFIARY